MIWSVLFDELLLPCTSSLMGLDSSAIFALSGVSPSRSAGTARVAVFLCCPDIEFCHCFSFTAIGDI